MWHISNMGNRPKTLENRTFSTKEALKMGLNKMALTRLVHKGILERVSRGVYIASKNESGNAVYGDHEKRYIAATIRCSKPSAVCLLSALEYYHLTDIITKQTWMMVPDSKRVRSRQLRLIRSRRPFWNHGIIKEKDYWITSIERTIIDSFIYAKLIGQNTAIEALKKAVKQKVKPKDILDLASRLKVKHRIMPYLAMVIS